MTMFYPHHIGRIENLIDMRASARWHLDEMQRDGDAKHFQAAEILERLLDSLAELQDSKLHRLLYEHWQRDPDDFNREVAETLRDVGFKIFPEYARDLLYSVERILNMGA